MDFWRLETSDSRILEATNTYGEGWERESGCEEGEHDGCGLELHFEAWGWYENGISEVVGIVNVLWRFVCGRKTTFEKQKGR